MKWMIGLLSMTMERLMTTYEWLAKKSLKKIWRTTKELFQYRAPIINEEYKHAALGMKPIDEVDSDRNRDRTPNQALDNLVSMIALDYSRCSLLKKHHRPLSMVMQEDIIQKFSVEDQPLLYFILSAVRFLIVLAQHLLRHYHPD